MTTLHMLNVPLYPSPVALHILGVHTSHWINKVEAVVYNNFEQMVLDIAAEVINTQAPK